MKIHAMLRYISLLLGLIVTMCASEEIRADPVTFAPAVAFSITSVELTPRMKKIECGKSVVFTLTLKGDIDESRGGVTLRYTVFAEKNNTKLTETTRFMVVGDGTGKFTEEQMFTLECTDDCILKGAGGSTGDKAATIFAVIQNTLDMQVGKSNKAEVECVTAPEPTTMLLLSTGLVGVAIKTRKRLKNRKSG